MTKVNYENYYSIFLLANTSQTSSYLYFVSLLIGVMKKQIIEALFFSQSYNQFRGKLLIKLNV